MQCPKCPDGRLIQHGLHTHTDETVSRSVSSNSSNASGCFGFSASSSSSATMVRDELTKVLRRHNTLACCSHCSYTRDEHGEHVVGPGVLTCAFQLDAVPGERPGGSVRGGAPTAARRCPALWRSAVATDVLCMAAPRRIRSPARGGACPPVPPRRSGRGRTTQRSMALRTPTPSRAPSASTS
jgi:hypothetical protein